MTLQEQADKEGVTKQAVWQRTPKGRAWMHAYHHTFYRTKKYRLLHRHQYHTSIGKAFANCVLCTHDKLLHSL